MYKLIFTESYQKKEKAFFKKHPDLKQRYKKTLKLLMENPYHPSLRLHKLKGNLKDYYLVSITMNYRILVDFVVIENRIILLDIGSHGEVY